MRLVTALFAALLIAGPATAQEADPRGVAALEACIADAAPGGATAVTARCVGAQSAACGESQITTNDIAGCIMAEYRAWDALLNRWWGPLRAQAQADGTWDDLLAAQRTWIAEKEAACDAAYASTDGTIRTIYYAECQRDRTAARTVLFHSRLEQ